MVGVSEGRVGGDISNSHKLCSVSWTLTLFLGMYQATNQEVNNNN